MATQKEIDKLKEDVKKLQSTISEMEKRTKGEEKKEM